MPAQPLMAEVPCRYTPVYVNMDGRLYIGREMEKRLKFEIPNTSIIDIPPTNRTSRIGYPHYNATNADTTETNTLKEQLRWSKTFLNSPVALRGAIGNALPLEAATTLRHAARVALPVKIVADYAGGHSLLESTTANVIAFEAGYLVSRATVILMKHSYEVTLAARLAMAGHVGMIAARSGNIAITLIGLIVGFLAPPAVSNYILTRKDHYRRAYPTYDDWPQDYESIFNDEPMPSDVFVRYP